MGLVIGLGTTGTIGVTGGVTGVTGVVTGVAAAANAAAMSLLKSAVALGAGPPASDVL